jgi:hypothetical protein
MARKKMLVGSVDTGIKGLERADCTTISRSIYWLDPHRNSLRKVVFFSSFYKKKGN